MTLDVRKAAKEIAAASLPPKRDREGEVVDTFGEFVRQTVQLRLPLKDPTRVRRHLQLLRGEIDRCLVILADDERKDTSVLFAVSGILRMANSKINAYRKIRVL